MGVEEKEEKEIQKNRDECGWLEIGQERGSMRFAPEAGMTPGMQGRPAQN